MDIENNTSFMELMEIGLTRKHIIKNISSCNDIDNLTKACQQLNYLITNDRIRRNMVWYKDIQKMYIRANQQFLQNQNVLEIKDIEFKVKFQDENISTYIEQSSGEFIIEEGIICIRVYNLVQNYEDEEVFYKKMVEELKLNCYSRKDATNLDFLVIYGNDNCMTLPILSYMKHENITCIEMLINVFLSGSNVFKRLSKNIFEGFPKLNKLVFWGPITEQKYNELEGNTSTLEYVICELSKRENPTLVLLSTYDSHYVIIKYLNLLLGISRRCGVKVLHKVINIFPVTNKDCDDTYPIEKCCYFSPILHHTTSIFNRILTSKNFFFTMNNLQNFLNLQKLILNFDFLDIQKGLQRMGKLDCPTLSLKACKNLKTVVFAFDKYINQKTNLKLQMFNNNIKYLASLMPSTIERLDLCYGFALTNEITEIFSQWMPNIKIFQVKCIPKIDNECLNVFKNLKVFIYDQNYVISIPKTVELLIINFFKSKTTDHKITIDQKVLESYWQKFFSFLQNKKNDYIFLNDIKCWNMYRDVIQNLSRM